MARRGAGGTGRRRAGRPTEAEAERPVRERVLDLVDRDAELVSELLRQLIATLRRLVLVLLRDGLQRVLDLALVDAELLREVRGKGRGEAHHDVRAAAHRAGAAGAGAAFAMEPFARTAVGFAFLDLRADLLQSRFEVRLADAERV